MSVRHFTERRIKTIDRKLKILKAVLLLRKINKRKSKAEQAEEIEKSYTDREIDEWIAYLKNPEGVENQEDIYTSCTAGDYSPSNPWDAPGMSVSDFI